MSSALERLTELVRQAEARSRVPELCAEIRQAAGPLRAAEERARLADRRTREDRPARLRALAQADADKQQLVELIRKAVHLKPHLGPSREAEALIEAAEGEIEAKRREAQADLDAIDREQAESRRALLAALERYRQLRRTLERLQLPPDGTFADEDRLARDAERYFPAGQIQALVREIEEGEPQFALIGQKERHAQLMIWIGRLRRLQATDLSSVSEEDQEMLKQTFPRLVGISKQYMPGYIEAFRQEFTTDWDLYVADAQEQLRLASEAARREKDLGRQRREQEALEQERRRQASEAGQAALDELRGVIARFHLPDEGVEEFGSTLGRAIGGLGASDPRLLDLVRPYRDLLTGAEFRALRRNLERVIQEEQGENGVDLEPLRDVIAATQGLKALLIGGVAREEKRRELRRVFEFAELDWHDDQGNKPAMLDSLEQRVRNRGVDLVLILKEFVGHHVSSKLRPLCEQHGIPCLMVEHGYGTAQIAETLRRGLPRDG